MMLEIKWDGVLLIKLWTVRRSVDVASLWKQMTTLIVGSEAEYVSAFFVHLENENVILFLWGTKIKQI